MKKLTVILPTLNEEKAIVKVIKSVPKGALKRLGFETKILVIDGKSKDKTVKLAKEQGAEVIIQKGKGKGSAVKEVLTLLKKRMPDIAVMLDADYTYDPKEMPKMILPLIIEQADVTVGARQGRTHYIGNALLTGIANRLFKNNTRDLCTGYWGFSSKAIRQIDVSAKGFDIETDLFAQVNKNKLRMKSVNIKYRERIGTSKLKRSDAIKIVLRIVRNIRDWNPLVLFGLTGFICIIASLFFGVQVAYDYAQNGYVGAVGTFILTVFLAITGFFLSGIGLILDLIERRT
jgi:dolichol-phosphate mannosyltransferase